MQTQAKTQAKTAKIDGKIPDGVSIWSYKTKKGSRWAFEARYKTSAWVIKRQIRGFLSKPACLKAISEAAKSPPNSRLGPRMSPRRDGFASKSLEEKN